MLNVDRLEVQEIGINTSPPELPETQRPESKLRVFAMIFVKNA